MSDFNIIKNCIKAQLSEGNKNFIIYPCNEQGVLAEIILEKIFGISAVLMVDNGCSEISNAVDFEFLNLWENRHSSDNYVVLVTSYNEETVHDILQCCQYKDSIVDVFAQSREENIKCVYGIPVKYSSNVGRYSYGPLTEFDEQHVQIGSFSCFARGTDIVWNHELDMVTLT